MFINNLSEGKWLKIFEIFISISLFSTEASLFIEPTSLFLHVPVYMCKAGRLTLIDDDDDDDDIVQHSMYVSNTVACTDIKT